MITLRSNIIFANGSPLFQFDSMTEAIIHMMQLGYHGAPAANGGFVFSK